MKTTNSPSGMPNADPRWRARRKGNRFCAPACGRGCTVAEHRRAKELAASMAAKLGRGWRGVIWENMGWHAEAVHADGIVVNTSGPRLFRAAAYTGSHQVGRSGVRHQHSGHGTTPTAALKALRSTLQEVGSRAYFLVAKIDGE